MTSGPFMKKLRRAQRLLKEARVKTKHERQLKVTKWRAVMDRYKEKRKFTIYTPPYLAQ